MFYIIETTEQLNEFFEIGYEKVFIDKLVEARIKGIGSDTYRLENPIVNFGKILSSNPFGSYPEIICKEFNKTIEKNLMHRTSVHLQSRCQCW